MCGSQQPLRVAIIFATRARYGALRYGDDTSQIQQLPGLKRRAIRFATDLSMEGQLA